MVYWFAAVVRGRQLFITLALVGVVMLAACSARPTRGKTAAEPTPHRSLMTTALARDTASASASSAAVAPFPKASPVAVAGWQAMTSAHWAGYTFPVSGVSGVRARWTEPSVTGPADAEEFVWIGVGGWKEAAQNIIQVGTFAYFPSSYQTNQGIWYERVPGSPAQFPLIDVSPGDEIAASVVLAESPHEEWRISLTDISGGQTFTKVVKFDSLGAYPSFVVEDPNRAAPGPYGPFYLFPHWGTVSFSDMQIRIAGRWRPAASIYGYCIQMVQHGRTLATAGPLDVRSGFTARQRSS